MRRTQMSKRLVVLAILAAIGNSPAASCTRQSRADWRAEPARAAYNEFLERNKQLWNGPRVVVDSQVRAMGGPTESAKEEPRILFLLDRSVLSSDGSARFGEFHPYSATDTMDLMLSIRMAALARPVKDTVEVTVMASVKRVFSYAMMLVVKRETGWSVIRYSYYES